VKPSKREGSLHIKKGGEVLFKGLKKGGKPCQRSRADYRSVV